MNKDERLAIRMTEGEREALQKAALMELRNESEMARELLREGLQRRGVWPMNQQTKTNTQEEKAA